MYSQCSYSFFYPGISSAAAFLRFTSCSTTFWITWFNLRMKLFLFSNLFLFIISFKFLLCYCSPCVDSLPSSSSTSWIFNGDAVVGSFISGTGEGNSCWPKILYIVMFWGDDCSPFYLYGENLFSILEVSPILMPVYSSSIFAGLESKSFVGLPCIENFL